MEDRNRKRVCACPLNGKACVDGIRDDFPEYEEAGIKIKAKCRWWERLAGKDPQSETIVDQWDCAVAWLPITSIEGAQMTRQATASIDKLSNQVAEVKQATSAMSGAMRVAAASISQAIEAGALTVMLPPPGGSESPNGSEREPRG